MKQEYHIRIDDIRTEHDGVGFTLKTELPKGMKVFQITMIFSEILERFGIEPDDIMVFRQITDRETNRIDLNALRKLKDGE